MTGQTMDAQDRTLGIGLRSARGRCVEAAHDRAAVHLNGEVWRHDDVDAAHHRGDVDLGDAGRERGLAKVELGPAHDGDDAQLAGRGPLPGPRRAAHDQQDALMVAHRQRRWAPGGKARWSLGSRSAADRQSAPQAHRESSCDGRCSAAARTRPFLARHERRRRSGGRCCARGHRGPTPGRSQGSQSSSEPCRPVYHERHAPCPPPRSRLAHAVDPPLRGDDCGTLPEEDIDRNHHKEPMRCSSEN